MANSNSAKKRIRQTVKRTLRNKVGGTRVKSGMRQFKSALKQGDLDAARALLRRAGAQLDRAAQKRTIHRNKANRLKGRLAKQLNEAAGASQ